MARIRSVKPEFWTDGNVIGLSLAARLFYIGTWNFSLCDRGHLPDDPVGLKLRILPADNVDGKALLDELLTAGRLVRRRSTDGRSYLFNPRLADHQKIDARWQSRCPHCASEQEGPFVEETVSLPETPPSSRESSESPPIRAVTEPNPPLGSKGEDGIGGDRNQHAARAVAVASDPPTSLTQRSRQITNAYSAIEPMCKWPAINAIVIRALKTEKWADDEVRDALLRLAAEGRSVTVDTLRVELSGLPPPKRADNGLVEVNGFHLTAQTAQRMTVDRQRLAAMDQQRLAIEGPSP